AFSVLDGVWVLLLLSALLPVLQRRRLEMRRLQFLRSWERRTKHRLIALIHRQETMSFIGFPIVRYIDIQDSEEVLRALRLTADDIPIDIVLHTPGGLALAAEQIAHAICARKGKVTVYVPHYAMSGGTLIALAADEIVMDPNAVLGSLDPQLGQHPAASIVHAIEWKSERNQEVDDETVILADVARKAIVQLFECVRGILTPRPCRARGAGARSGTRDGGAGRRGRRLRFDSAPLSRVPRPAAARGAEALRRRPRPLRYSAPLAVRLSPARGDQAGDRLSSLHVPRRDEGARRVGPRLRRLQSPAAEGARRRDGIATARAAPR